MHIHTQVRHRVSNALRDTSVQTIKRGQSIDLFADALPAAVIAIETDSVARFSKGTKDSGPEQLRTPTLTITLAISADTESMSDQLDALRAEIETVVPRALKEIALDVRHVGGESDHGQEEDGDRWFGFLALGWEVDLITEVSNPLRAL